MSTHRAAVLIVAAGRGLRMGSTTPKQYLPIAGRPLLAHTLDAFSSVDDLLMLVVINLDDRHRFDAASCKSVAGATGRLLPPVGGGATRQESVRSGLLALSQSHPDLDVVLIHDGARPFPTRDLIQRALDAGSRDGAAVPALLLTDTVKQVNTDGQIVATPARAALRTVQTPQSFSFPRILRAHIDAHAAGARDLTDDAALMEWAGFAVSTFDGEPGNMKVTTPEDFEEASLRLMRDCPDIRTGQGYDVHAFGDGDHIWLGGCKVPHSHGLIGHSDADVLSHAVTDALYGAISDGDIGSHFPPSDPQWRGASSEIFLKAAVEAVKARGGMISHVDATIVCEMPKVGPHREAIRASLSDAMGISLGRVAVKATTSERLGFTGRQEGIAALAIATVRLPVGA